MPRIRILLDQNAPLGLRRLLSGHNVATAARLGWSTIQNGDLIRAGEEAGFAVLVTCDRNIRHQQNLAGRQLALTGLPDLIRRRRSSEFWREGPCRDEPPRTGAGQL
jgi:hypothetical protein